MNKKAYIIPAVNVLKLNVENMMAVSGPGTSDGPADPDKGMDTKESSDWDIW
ncbi:MAG: hypothetical protein IJ700_05385 [Bacteroidaceae bacterium]|nr:hypothetical protein [Bacteroidaceae bacterium]